jgi:RNA polymerase sigma-70 factor (ECF subfamily)
MDHATLSPPGAQMVMTSPAPDDRVIAEEYLRSRSEVPFLALYDRHTDPLFRFAARLCGGSRGEAAEVVQETWLRALGALPSFRWKSSLRTWLCAIALNCRREQARHDARHQPLSVIEGTAVTPPVDVRAVDAVALERALAALPEGYREVLLLHDLEGYSHEEIARHFGIVEGTSKSQLHRARRALREALGHRHEVRA